MPVPRITPYGVTANRPRLHPP